LWPHPARRELADPTLATADGVAGQVRGLSRSLIAAALPVQDVLHQDLGPTPCAAERPGGPGTAAIAVAGEGGADVGAGVHQ